MNMKFTTRNGYVISVEDVKPYHLRARLYDMTLHDRVGHGETIEQALGDLIDDILEGVKDQEFSNIVGS